MNRGKAILIAFDQLINTLLGGWPDETISSRCWRWSKDGKRDWPRRCIDAVARLFGDKDHCWASYISERMGRQQHPEMRRMPHGTH